MIYKLYGLFSYILINIVVFCLINEIELLSSKIILYASAILINIALILLFNLYGEEKYE